MDTLFADTGHMLNLIGCVVIKRDVWLSRQRDRYYGSLFIHVGVIFQARLPADALVIAEPLIAYRKDNQHSFSARLFEIFMFDWPVLVWSLALSESSKRKVCSPEPWRDLWSLLRWRAVGIYSLREYQRVIRPRLSSGRETLIPGLVARLPCTLVNTVLVLYYSCYGRHRLSWLHWLKRSRFYIRNWFASKHAS